MHKDPYRIAEKRTARFLVHPRPSSRRLSAQQKPLVRICFADHHVSTGTDQSRSNPAYSASNPPAYLAQATIRPSSLIRPRGLRPDHLPRPLLLMTARPFTHMIHGVNGGLRVQQQSRAAIVAFLSSHEECRSTILRDVDAKPLRETFVLEIKPRCMNYSTKHNS